MARKQKGETEARWREILERQEGSGLSIRSFCVVEGIREPSFYAWRKRLGLRKAKGARAVGQESSRETAGDDNARLFIPLKLLDAGGASEIVHPLGWPEGVYVLVNHNAVVRLDGVARAKLEDLRMSPSR